MLSKGLRDKESTRIDHCLKQLHSLVLPPLDWNLDRRAALEGELKDFAMDLESLNDFSPEDLLLHFQKKHLLFIVLSKKKVRYFRLGLMLK